MADAGNLLGEPFECSLEQAMEQAQQRTIPGPLANALLRAAVEFSLQREGSDFLAMFAPGHMAWGTDTYDGPIHGYRLTVGMTLDAARRGVFPAEDCNLLLQRALEWIAGHYGDGVLAGLVYTPCIKEK